MFEYEPEPEPSTAEDQAKSQNKYGDGNGNGRQAQRLSISIFLCLHIIYLCEKILRKTKSSNMAWLGLGEVVRAARVWKGWFKKREAKPKMIAHDPQTSEYE